MTLPGVNHLDIWGTVLGLKLQAGGHDKVDELTLDRLGGGGGGRRGCQRGRALLCPPPSDPHKAER